MFDDVGSSPSPGFSPRRSSGVLPDRLHDGGDCPDDLVRGGPMVTDMSGHDPGPAGGETLDFLTVVRRSGVLADRALRKVRVKVEGGLYPSAPIALAERLVREGVLTQYQADRLLRNKAHGLVVDRYV